MFLHSAKFDVDRALKYMISNYKYRSIIPCFFEPKDPMSKEMIDVHNTMWVKKYIHL